jgi:hypothetical protein
MNRLLRICGDYAKDWKLEFSINKCNWTCFGKEVYNDAKFPLQNQELCYSENVIHLGLPIGSREFVNNHLKEKFKKVERSFYSLYGLGCKPNGLNPFTIADIYKTFCQSIMLYGFEIFNYSNSAVNELNIRQNILIKHSIGLSKFVRTTPLFTALRIKSIMHLIYQHKLCFVRQIFNVTTTRGFYYYLEEFYKNNTPGVDSFFKYYKKITEICEIEETLIDKNKIKEKLSRYFQYNNDGNGLIDSIRTTLNRFVSHNNSKEQLDIVSMFLAIRIHGVT